MLGEKTQKPILDTNACFRHMDAMTPCWRAYCSVALTVAGVGAQSQVESFAKSARVAPYGFVIGS